MRTKDNFINLYLKWLKENFEEYQINENTFRITLPFLNKDNDMIDIYVIRQDDDSFLITDDGATLNDLELSGFDPLNSIKRATILESILIAHGVRRDKDNALTVKCTIDDLALKKHMLAQCMIKVSDMFYLSRNKVQSLFLEDVQQFFNENKIQYVPNVDVIGKSRLPTHYDFIIGRTENAPERLIKVVNNLDLTTAKTIIFAWNDTRDVRAKDSRLYTFIQDIDKNVSKSGIDALREYAIYPALWTKRYNYVKPLSA